MALFWRRIALDEVLAAVKRELADPAVRASPPAALRELQRVLGAELSEAPRDALQAIVDAIPDPAAVLGEDGRCVLANAGMDALFGAGRVVGRTPLEITRSDELAAAVRSQKLDGEHDLPALQKRVLARARPLPLGRTLLLLRDLTEQQRREAVRRDFIANASHELRTPVAAIKGAVETLLGMNTLDEGARKFAEMIVRHADRLARLTQDLLDLSRLESGQYRVSPEGLNLAPFVANVIELMQAKAAQKKQTLAADLPDALQVRADRRALEQVLVNLVDNAIKFTPDGGRVTVLADETAHGVVLSVIDNGPGLEERHRERVFERFWRADSGRGRDAGGTGLGLAIVKHLVLAQNGEVGVESGRGGSRFWVRLPRA